MTAKPIITAALLLAFATGFCRAQDSPPLPTFARLFPQPTGKNGYEEIVTAGDTLRASRLLQEAQEAGPAATLAAKRAVLADPPVKRALALLRLSLSKPRAPIHPHIDEATAFPEFALFRNTSRTLAIEQYVKLADGEVNGALNSLRDTFRLGIACETDSMIAGLVQIAIDQIAIRQLAGHLGQLSARDCERVLALVREWLALPDPAIEVLNAERRQQRALWDKLRTDPQRLIGGLDEISDRDEQEDGTAARRRTELESLATNPAAYARLVDTVQASSEQRYSDEMRNLLRPPWDRVAAPVDARDSLAGFLTAVFRPWSEQTLDRFTTDVASMRLLGVHAAILRHLWEYDRLPERLEDLRAKDLIIDPYSGKPFSYRRTGPRTYDLSSIGPSARTDDGKSISGKRNPIILSGNAP